MLVAAKMEVPSLLRMASLAQLTY